VEFRVEEVIGEVILQGNRKAISGALTNLLENALQAASRVPHSTQNGGGEVLLAVRRDGDALAFSIRDNGPGLTASVTARLFEPFFTTRPEGTGLGLAIARGVARAHGGNIEAVSALGCGTEFIVTLPLARIAADSASLAEMSESSYV